MTCRFNNSVYSPEQSHSHPLQGGCALAREFLFVLDATGNLDEAFGRHPELSNDLIDTWENCLDPRGIYTSVAYHFTPEVQMSNSNAQRVM